MIVTETQRPAKKRSSPVRVNCKSGQSGLMKSGPLKRMVQRCKDFSGKLLNQFILTSVLICVSVSGGCKNSDFIDKAVVGMILLDNMPLMACQKKGMKSYFKKLFPNYELPSSDLVWRHNKKFYDACMVAIKASLGKRIGDNRSCHFAQDVQVLSRHDGAFLEQISRDGVSFFGMYKNECIY